MIHFALHEIESSCYKGASEVLQEEEEEEEEEGCRHIQDNNNQS